MRSEQTQERRGPASMPRVLCTVLIAFALLTTVYSITVPVFEASDELWHYPMVETLARTWQLPVQPLEAGMSSGPWRQEGSQPPLYYALGALLTTWIDTGDMPAVRQENPHARAGEITPERDNVNLVIHDPAAEAFPWSGTVLAVHLVRLLSVALSVGSVYLTWALLNELYADTAWIPLAGAAVHAFTPMHVFIAGSINNDNLIVPLCTFALLLIVRRVKDAGSTPRQGGILSYAAIGLITGLALLTKASGLALLPFGAAAIAWETWRRLEGESQRRRMSQSHALKTAGLQLAAFLAPAAAVSGWWFYRNFRLYGDWLGLNAFYAVLGTRDVAADLGQLWAERFAFAAGYWGNFGGLNVPMPDLVYAVLNVVAVIAGAGVVTRFALWVMTSRGTRQSFSFASGKSHANEGASWLRNLWPFAWTNLTAARALVWAWPVAVFVSWMRWATITWSSQGRLIFSALPMWSAALVIGLQLPAPPRPRFAARLVSVPPAIFAFSLFGLSVVALPAWILPAYRAPKPVTQSPTELGFTPLDVRFGNVIALEGYRLESEVVKPGDRATVSLMWRSLGATATPHSLFIHLLGEGDRIVAQRDTFPGHGLLPTTQLPPERTWVEEHAVAIPATAYAPDRLQIAVGVYETATHERVPPAAAEGDHVRFGDLALVRRDIGAAADAFAVHFGDGMVLTSYDVSDLVIAPGRSLTVTLNWRCTAPIPEDYTVSVQLIDDRWRKAAQSDEWPLGGQAPTSSWQVGEAVADERVLTVASDAEPGAYALQVAAYTAKEDGELVHAPVSQDRAGMPAKNIVLTYVRVQ
ncbi:MAG: ArnT family glycosyltransferase [Anaerolineae bacterium]